MGHGTTKSAGRRGSQGGWVGGGRMNTSTFVQGKQTCVAFPLLANNGPFNRETSPGGTKLHTTPKVGGAEEDEKTTTAVQGFGGKGS